MTQAMRIEASITTAKIAATHSTTPPSDPLSG